MRQSQTNKLECHHQLQFLCFSRPFEVASSSLAQLQDIVVLNSEAPEANVQLPGAELAIGSPQPSS